MGQCACTSDIKQLLGKMDIIQTSVAANNESYQGKLSLTINEHTQDNNLVIDEFCSSRGKVGLRKVGGCHLKSDSPGLLKKVC